MVSGHGPCWSMFICVFILSSVLMFNIPVSSEIIDQATEERKENSVEIQFYLLKESKWPGVEDDFKEAVSDGMTTFCSSNYLQCGLGGWDSSYQFTKSEVSVSEVEGLKYYLNITCYVKYNGNVPNWQTNVTDYVVNKAALLQVLRDSRKDINKAVGYDIVAADSDRFSPEPDNFLDYILIPIAVAVLLILIIVTVALHYWRASKDKSEKREASRKRKRHWRKRSENKAMKLQAERSTPSSKPPSRVGPAPHHDVEAGYDRDIRLDDRPRDRGLSAHSYAEELASSKQTEVSVMNSTLKLTDPPSSMPSFTEDVPTRPPKERSVTSSTFKFIAGPRSMPRADGDSFRGNQTDETIVNLADQNARSNSLPPLEDDRKEKRKHKKQKKHRRHRRQDDDDRSELQQQSGRFHDSDSDVYGRPGEYRSRDTSAIPAPAEYNKHRHDQEYYSQESEANKPNQMRMC